MYMVLAYTGTCIIDENSLFTNIYSCKGICIPWGLSPPPVFAKLHVDLI